MAMILKYMNKKGVTLLELFLGMILATLVFAAIAAIFTVERSQCLAIERRIANVQEAEIAMNHMEWTLRFAVPGSVNWNNIRLSADIQGGCIVPIPALTTIAYQRIASSNTLRYSGPPSSRPIANNITAFVPEWDNVTGELTISITAGQGNEAVTLQTIIRPIGENI